MANEELSSMVPLVAHAARNPAQLDTSMSLRRATSVVDSAGNCTWALCWTKELISAVANGIHANAQNREGSRPLVCPATATDNEADTDADWGQIGTNRALDLGKEGELFQ